MDLKFSGERLESVDFTGTAMLDFTGDHSVSIGETMQIRRGDGGRTDLHPSDDAESAADALSGFVGAVVAEASADQDTGTLVLSFEDGRRITVASHEGYEAWEYAGPNNRDVFCMPSGGGLNGRLGDLEPDH